jgi:hypothetical protein
MRRIGSDVPMMPGRTLPPAGVAEAALAGRTVTVERPMTKLAALGSRRAAGTRAPPTKTPFFEPRSMTVTPWSSQLSRQCSELTALSTTLSSALGPEPRVTCPPQASSNELSSPSQEPTSTCHGPATGRARSSRVG